MDEAWKAIPDKEDTWLFKNPMSNVEIRYASLTESKTGSPYNAVMKRVQIPTARGIQDFKREIKGVSNMNNGDSFRCGFSEEKKIGYIALKNDKQFQFVVPKEGGENYGKMVEAVANFKREKPGLER